MNLTTLTRPWTALLAGLWLGLIGPGPALSPAIQAQTTAPAPARIEVAKLGPQIGEQVPDFSLVDQHGKTWTRQSILGPKGAMLVFFRSADW